MEDLQLLDMSGVTPVAQEDLPVLDMGGVVPEQESWMDDVLGGTRSFLQGMTLGTADEIGIGLAAGAASLTTGDDFTKVYADMMNTYEQQQNAFEKANPVASTALEVAGGFASPASWGIVGKAGQLAKTRAGQGALAGSIEGGIYGAASSEGDIGDRLVQGVIGTATGGLLGGGIGKGVDKFVDYKASRDAGKILTKAQEDIYSNPVAQYATDPVSRLKSLKAEDGSPLYNALDIKKVKQAMAKEGRTLDVPKYTKQQEVQSMMVSEGNIIRKQKNALGQAADKWLGVLSTRVGNVSTEVKNKLRKYEADVAITTAQHLRDTQGFREGFRKLDDTTKVRVSQLLMEDNYTAAEKLLKAKNPALVPELANVRSVLDKIGSDLQHAGHTFSLRENYFPRVMKNYEEWRVTLGMAERSVIDKAVERYAKQKGMEVAQVSQKVKTDIANKVMRGFDPDNLDLRMGNTKQRVRDNIDFKEFGNYYMLADDALESYITRSVNDVKRRDFFGVKGSVLDEDLENTIGGFVNRFVKDPRDVNELQDLLRARFINGEQQMTKAGQFYRNLNNASTIGNVMSTITQVADLANPLFAYGMRNTVKGLVTSISGKGMKVSDVGLDHMIAQDMAKNSGSFMQSFTDELLRKTGFRLMDRLGKETFLNAGINKLKTQAASKAGRQALANKYSGMFDDTAVVLDDLQAGRMSDDVKALMFSELSDFQPISMSEMPEQYLNMKNGRLLYSLKSFTIKQMDVLRREVVQKAMKAETRKEQAEAAKSALKLFTALSSLNLGTQLTKDFILGREIKPEELPENFVWAGFGVYGMNKYTSGIYEREGLKGVIESQLPTAPLQLADSVVNEMLKEDPNIWNGIRKIPPFGQALYYWFGDGIENFEKASK